MNATLELNKLEAIKNQMVKSTNRISPRMLFETQVKIDNLKVKTTKISKTMKTLTKTEAEIILQEKGLSLEDAQYLMSLPKRQVPEILTQMNSDTIFYNGNLPESDILNVFESITDNIKAKTVKKTKEKAEEPVIKAPEKPTIDKSNKLVQKAVRSEVIKAITELGKDKEAVAIVGRFGTIICTYNASEAMLVVNMLAEVLENNSFDAKLLDGILKVRSNIIEYYKIA
jgi:hypothetical protein